MTDTAHAALAAAGDVLPASPQEGEALWVPANPGLYSVEKGLSRKADYGRALFI